MAFPDGVKYRVDVTNGGPPVSDTQTVYCDGGSGCGPGGALVADPGQPLEDGSVDEGATGLRAAYPNPFNPSTTLHFKLAKSATASLVIYDAMGREVARVLDKQLEAGAHEVVWDAAKLPSGVYLARLTAAGATSTETLILAK